MKNIPSIAYISWKIFRLLLYYLFIQRRASPAGREQARVYEDSAKCDSPQAFEKIDASSPVGCASACCANKFSLKSPNIIMNFSKNGQNLLGYVYTWQCYWVNRKIFFYTL